METNPTSSQNQILIPITTYILESHATKETSFSIQSFQERDIHIMGKNNHTVIYAKKRFLTSDRVIILVVIQKLIVTMMSASTASKERERRNQVKLKIKKFTQSFLKTQKLKTLKTPEKKKNQTKLIL